ncbi:1-acyl-sn-glycerol-3-phosphate acyltransferase [Asticcacaulis sp. SL142]|uniref:GNAT family N-acetyltransferase n=1 Tax=Asticcacaulis sp. SL142 TaxID=2995155 RepID=UPI00226C9BB0|nr:1-acyl-sn-glycerol-3-phosphate acyltransferase [Asticcacaulis sp. SL142]WAC49962.1 1-acyl-sn-glycerol-3-phosphate acyltransferase [Asticcacaulis sp. SL142]
MHDLTVDSLSVAKTANPSGLHIVDVLIHERAPRLVASPLWPVVRPALYNILGYGAAVRMADAIAPLSGQAALDHVSNLLSLKVVMQNLERVPASGRCIVVCNHPTGIADGVVVYDALKTRRDDLIFFANADALRVSPRLGEVLIPVEWVEAKRTREKTRATLMAAKAAFEAERCVVLFPAGRLARKRGGVLRDPDWATTAVSLVQKYQAPMVPVHVAGPNSVWFHSFDKISKELRDVTLFLELLNKAGKRFDLTVGPVITPDELTGEVSVVCAAVKDYVETQLCHGDAAFTEVGP